MHALSLSIYIFLYRQLTKRKATVDEDMLEDYRLRYKQWERESNAPVVEVSPPPLNDGINTLRFIVHVTDPDSDPCQSFTSRVAASTDHVEYCMRSSRMSAKDKEVDNVPTVVFSHGILASNLLTEVGQVSALLLVSTSMSLCKTAQILTFLLLL